MERRPHCLLGCQPSWLLTRSFVHGCQGYLADQLEDVLLHLSVAGLNDAIYPCGCLNGSGLLVLSPEAYHVIVKLLTSSALHLQFLSQCLYGLFETLNEAEVVRLSDCVGPSSRLDGTTISRVVGFTAVRLGFGPSASLGGWPGSHDGGVTPPWAQWGVRPSG